MTEEAKSGRIAGCIFTTLSKHFHRSLCSRQSNVIESCPRTFPLFRTIWRVISTRLTVAKLEDNRDCNDIYIIERFITFTILVYSSILINTKKNHEIVNPWQKYFYSYNCNLYKIITVRYIHVHAYTPHQENVHNVYAKMVLILLFQINDAQKKTCKIPFNNSLNTHLKSEQVFIAQVTWAGNSWFTVCRWICLEVACSR